jgi:hypothetical protein
MGLWARVMGLVGGEDGGTEIEEGECEDIGL